MKTIKKQKGTTMIEVLVTIVIVAFSLLGFAGLLAKSIKDSRTAYTRSQATFMAYSILESMRANWKVAREGAYNYGFTSNVIGNTLAAQDVRSWKTEVSQQLPGGQGSITTDSLLQATIIIRWDEDGDGELTTFTTKSLLKGINQ